MPTPRGATPSFVHSKTYHVGRSPASVAIADLNCDGRPDIVDTSGRGRVSVLLNRGGGHLGPRRGYETGAYPSAVVVGDLDHDGDRDLAVAGAAGVSVLLNGGDGTFEPRADYAAGYDLMSIALADLDGDGALDLAAGANEGTSSVLLNRGDGTFRDARHYDSTLGPTWIAAGDVDGDDRRDLAVVTNDWSDEVEDGGVTLQPAYAYLFANRGNGRFPAPRRLFKTFGYDEGLDSLAIADVDGDAKPDLVVGRDIGQALTGVVFVLLNDGHGGFRNWLDYLVGGADDASGTIAVGDINGDGTPDLVTVNPASSSVSVFINRAGRCTVQDVSGTLPGPSGYEGSTLPAARAALERAGCRVGRIDRAYSPLVTVGRVISQKPKFGAVLRAGSGVDLVISKGRKR